MNRRRCRKELRTFKVQGGFKSIEKLPNCMLPTLMDSHSCVDHFLFLSVNVSSVSAGEKKNNLMWNHQIT